MVAWMTSSRGRCLFEILKKNFVEVSKDWKRHHQSACFVNKTYLESFEGPRMSRTWEIKKLFYDLK